MVLFSLAVTGCSSGAPEVEPAEQVVTNFFDRLIEGDAAGAGALLSDPSLLSAAALSNDVYSEAVRPVEARITFVWSTRVDVEYRLDGEPVSREMTVSTRMVDGEPRITEWRDFGLSLTNSGFPGYLLLEGTIGLSWSEPLKLFPGIYDLAYVDEQGLVTIDPEGGPSDPFVQEFPVDPTQVGETPPGMERFGFAIGFEPVLRADVAVEVEARIDEMLASCTANDLRGDDCPPDLSDAVAARAYLGDLDANSMVWEQDDSLELLRGDEVHVRARYAMSFSVSDFDFDVNVAVDVSVQRDAVGSIVVDLD